MRERWRRVATSRRRARMQTRRLAPGRLVRGRPGARELGTPRFPRRDPSGTQWSPVVRVLPPAATARLPACPPCGFPPGIVSLSTDHRSNVERDHVGARSTDIEDRGRSFATNGPLRQIGSFAPAEIPERCVQPRYAGTRRERNHHAPTCANAEYQILRVCCGVVTAARRVVVGRAADRRVGGNQISAEQRIRIGSPSPVLSLRAETCVHGDHGVGRGH
jgi:hypothetical protein